MRHCENKNRVQHPQDFRLYGEKNCLRRCNGIREYYDAAKCISTVEKQEDGTYLLSGGGYGHGLGMSQNGANGMAKAGMGYQDILNYFYQDITVETIGEMEGKETL